MPMSRFRTILVPTDFSDHSAAALDLAIDVARTYGATLHLLHCYPIDPGAISPYGIVIPEGFDRDIREAAEQQLARWADKASAAEVRVELHLSGMFPAEVIAQTAGEIRADLIAMGTRGFSGLKHVLLGSVAERVLRLAPCPVLTVKAPDKR
jgi:nucleotide-binding universal stress UspA family protein